MGGRRHGQTENQAELPSQILRGGSSENKKGEPVWDSPSGGCVWESRRLRRGSRRGRSQPSFFSAESSTVSLPMISRSAWFSLLSFPISRADTGSSGVLGQPGVDCASRDAMFFGELRDGDYVFTIAGRTGATLRVEAPNPIVRWGQHLGQGDGDCSQKAGRQTKPAKKTDAHQCSCSDHRGRISRLWSRAKWGCSQWVRVASHFEGGISRDRLRLPQ